MLLLSDLHLAPESEEVVFSVLGRVEHHAKQHGYRIGVLGDAWHTRYQLPVRILNRFREFLLNSSAWWYFLPGNHDQYDVTGRHALEVFDGLPRVTVFHEPTWHPELGCWLPYRKDVGQLTRWIQDNPNPGDCPSVAFLHHGIVGARMNNGNVAGELDGLPLEALPFTRVYCGHWHDHQTVGHCVFVGSQYQTRADEAGQSKGYLELLPSGNYVRHIIHAGPKYHRLDGSESLSTLHVGAGDVVRVPAGAAAAQIKALVAKGAKVLVQPPPPPAVPARLAGTGTLREQAQRYVGLQQLPENTSAAELMAVYDEVASA